MELAHTVAVMREGQIAQSGPPQEIYLEPASRYVADFVGSSNELVGTLRSVDGGAALVETDLGAVSGVAADGIASGRPGRRHLPARAHPPFPARSRSRRTAGGRGSGERVPRPEPRARRPTSASTRSGSGASTRACSTPGPRAGSTSSRSTSGCCRHERLRPARARDVRQLPRASSPSSGSAAPSRAARPTTGSGRSRATTTSSRPLRDPAPFTTTVQNVVPRLAFTGRRPPLHLDPPDHTPYRAALNPYFTPEKMAAARAEAARDHRRPAQPLVDAGGGDFCEEFTYRLPGYVFAEFFNLTPELGLRIREASREFNLAVQDFVDEDVKRTSLQLYDIAREIIAMRKAEPLDPADDPASGLLAAPGLPEDMLLGTIRQFIVVGMIAPSVFIGSMVIHLAEHPDAAAAAARRPVPRPRRGRGVPAAAHAVPRLRADADARRRDRRAADPQGRARRAWSSRRPTATRTSSPSPTASCSTGRTSAPRRLRRGPAPLRRRAARTADAAAHARGAARAHLGDRGRRRAEDDALAGVGDAVGSGAACPSLTSTRSTRRSSPTRTRRGRGSGASARSRTALAGTSWR